MSMLIQISITACPDCGALVAMKTASEMTTTGMIDYDGTETHQAWHENVALRSDS